MSSSTNKPFVPTEEQRTVVKMLAAIMTPQPEIAKAIINPETKKPISPVTLRTHFPEELENGAIQVKAFTVGKLFQLIQKGVPSAIFFFLKTKCGFKETNVHEFQGLGTFDLSKMSDGELDDIRAGRITTELLARLRATAQSGPSAQPGPAGPAQTDSGGGVREAPAGAGANGGVAPDSGGPDKPVANPADG